MGFINSRILYKYPFGDQIVQKCDEYKEPNLVGNWSEKAYLQGGPVVERNIGYKKQIKKFTLCVHFIDF